MEATESSEGLDTECPATARRGVRISDLRLLIQDRASWLCNKRGMILSEVQSAQLAAPDSARDHEKEGDSKVLLTTLQDHYFGKFDGVSLRNPKWEKPVAARVLAVPGPRELLVGVAIGPDAQSALEASVVECSMNMYHLCNEVVIPWTTRAEMVVELKSEEDVAALRDALDDGVNLSLKRDVSLSGRQVPAGMTIHGRLGANGTVRRHYWLMQGGRRQAWAPASPLESGSGIVEMPLDEPPKGFAEVEQRLRSPEVLKPGDWVAMRRGVSFAELCGKNTITAFLSHWWGEPSYELLSTLQCFSRDRGESQDVVFWICTMANNQHCVELGHTWKESPFNQALEYLAHRQSLGKPASVLMALDRHATTWTRIWCAFEAYRCRHLDLAMELYHIDGRLQRGDSRPLARQMIETVRGMDLQNASASEPGDKQMILEAIHTTVGMVAVHAMLKLNIMDLSTFVGTLATSVDVLTGKELEEVPVTIMRSGGGLATKEGFKPFLNAETAFASMLQSPSVGWVIRGRPGAGKSVLSKRLVRLAQQSVQDKILPIRIPLGELADFWRKHLAEKGSGCSGADVFQAWARHQFGKDAELLEAAGSGTARQQARTNEEAWADNEEPQKILVFLDGFDEAGEMRVPILEWLERYLNRRGDVIRVLLTRPSGLEGRIPSSKGRDYTDWLLNMGFRTYWIKSMRRDNAREMLLRQPHMPQTPVARRLIEEVVSGSSKSSGLWTTPLMVSFISHYIAARAGKSTSLAQLQVSISGAKVLQFALDVLAEQAAVETGLTKALVLHKVQAAAMATHSRNGSRIMTEDLFSGEAHALWDAARTKRLRLLEPAGDGVQIFHLKGQEYLCAKAILEKDATLESFFDDGDNWDGNKGSDNARFKQHWVETLSIALDLKVDQCTPFEYIVRLDKRETKSWGFELEKSGVIKKLNDSPSAVSSWNAVASQEARIREEDRILEVNGRAVGRSLDELWDEINQSPTLLLRLCRRSATRKGCWRPRQAFIAAEVRNPRALRVACRYGRTGAQWCGLARSTVAYLPTGVRISLEEWTVRTYLIFLIPMVIMAGILPPLGVLSGVALTIRFVVFVVRRYILKLYARRIRMAELILVLVQTFVPFLILASGLYWLFHRISRLCKRRPKLQELEALEQELALAGKDDLEEIGP